MNLSAEQWLVVEQSMFRNEDINNRIIEERKQGHIRAKIQITKYGYCLFDPFMGGCRITSFYSEEEIKKVAQDWVNENPEKHHLY